jgi:phosphate transport system substrate-binding protein
MHNRAVNPTRIGEYRVIASLDSGGMADVYLAARLGPVNFTKLVVIKRLRADLARQPEAKRYRALLLDEARVAARMHHPNIVQTFEVTEADGEPYITMEFLDGQSVAHVVRTARRAHVAIPIEMSLSVVADVLGALSYAHDLRDFDGTPLEIIHRDVSPQNVFWTYEGEIKLVDFGVAKSTTGSTRTAAGTIKGKVAYMAPEQARGEPIDKRADVFAAGVLLWELVAGRRLYKASSQAASLHKLLYEPVPELSEIAPSLDPAIASVCMRALAHDPDRRYPDAATMRADLEDVLDATRPRREQLAAFIRELFTARRQAVADLIRNALSQDDSEVVRVPLSDGDDSESSAEAASDVESATESTATVASRPSRRSRPAGAIPPARSASGRRGVVVALVSAIAATCVAAGGVLYWREQREPEPPDRSIAARPAADATVAPTGPTPTLRLCGSNTIGAELGPALLDAFLRKRGGADIERRSGATDVTTIVATLGGEKITLQLEAHGSATAFDGLAAGTCDVGMASRAISDAETAKLIKAGIGDLRSPATEHVIALDGIAVIVHPNNPVRALDRDALHDIFTGKLASWDRVGGKAEPITVYSRDDKSGTFDTFKSLVLGDDKLAASAKRISDSDALADAVATDPSAIGFIGLAYVRSAKPVAVGDVGTSAMLPTAFTVTTEDYMLSRRLYFYTTPTPRTPLVPELVSFAMSRQGQVAVRDAGFVDLELALRETEPCTHRCPPRYASLVAHAKRVSFDFRFRAGRDDIDSRASRDLDRMVQLMRAHPGAKLLLIGFSDEVSEASDQANLSLGRAQAIARELGMRGITPSVVDGFGGALPVASNASGVGRERNRRVEVWLQER